MCMNLKNNTLTVYLLIQSIDNTGWSTYGLAKTPPISLLSSALGILIYFQFSLCIGSLNVL